MSTRQTIESSQELGEELANAIILQSVLAAEFSGLYVCVAVIERWKEASLVGKVRAVLPGAGYACDA